MSHTTTCMAVIGAVSGIGTNTVEKLYALLGVDMPVCIREKPIPYHRMGKVVEAVDVLVNASVHAVWRDDTDIYSYPIWGGVYVVYTRE